MKYLELEIYNLRIQILILLKNSAFGELQALIELIFWFIFQFSRFILRESAKRCLMCLILILKERLISKNLHIIREKADTALISVYLSCNAENFKTIL